MEILKLTKIIKMLLYKKQGSKSFKNNKINKNF